MKRPIAASPSRFRFVSAWLGLLAVTGVQAYDNCDSLRANDRAYRECVNNAYGANPGSSSPGSAEANLQNYVDRLKSEAEAGRAAKRQAEQEKRARFEEEMRQETLRENERKALEQVRETERIYGTPRQREEAYAKAGSLYSTAMTLQAAGNDQQAEALLREAEQWMAKATLEHPHDYPLILESLGESLRRQGRYEEALPILLKAMYRRQHLTNVSHPFLGDVLISLGRTYMAMGRYDDGESVLQRALNIRQEQYGKSSVDAGYCHEYLGSLYQKQKRFKDSESHFRKAYEISREKRGAEHPDTVRLMKRLARLYRDNARDPDADRLDNLIREAVKDPQYKSISWEAEWNALGDEIVNLSSRSQVRRSQLVDKAREALSLAEANDGPERQAVTSSRHLLAQMLWRDGKLDEAEAQLKEVQRFLAEKGKADDHPGMLSTLRLLAKVHDDQKRYEDAETLYRRVLAAREKRLEQEPDGVIESLDNLAGHYARRGGHVQEQAAMRQRILDIQEKRFGADGDEVADALTELARLRYDNKEYSEAEALYQRAITILEKDKKGNAAQLWIVLGKLRNVYADSGREADAERVARYRQQF